MTWDDVIKIVITAVGGLSGTVGIIYVVIKFSADHIAERLSAKYELRLNKELENFKSGLEKKNYVSKVRFDTEFEIFRQLHEAFSTMIKDVYFIAPTYANVPADDKEREEYEKNVYITAIKSKKVAEDILFKNAPFIQKELYAKFDEIFILCNRQTNAFSRRWNISYMASRTPNAGMPDDAYDRTTEIMEKNEQLVEAIREYLQSLEVIG